MGKNMKVWLIIAASFILIGCIMFGGVMMALNWDFSKLPTDKYETNSYEINEAYESIRVLCNTADITFVLADSDETSVVCYERVNEKHSVTVEDGTLVIQVNDTRKWYEYIGISFGSPKITLSLPGGEYGDLYIKDNTGDIAIPKDLRFKNMEVRTDTGHVSDLASAYEGIKIATDTGDILVEGVSAGILDLSVSTGKITVSSVKCDGDFSVRVSTGKSYLTDVECKTFTSEGSTGDISMKNLIASEKLFIERSTGNVKLDGCDAAEIFVVTDTGDVKGSLLTEKVFLATTDTGSINVPKTVTGGRCEITTDTGNIRITVG